MVGLLCPGNNRLGLIVVLALRMRNRCLVRTLRWQTIRPAIAIAVVVRPLPVRHWKMKAGPSSSVLTELRAGPPCLSRHVSGLTSQLVRPRLSTSDADRRWVIPARQTPDYVTTSSAVEWGVTSKKLSGCRYTCIWCSWWKIVFCYPTCKWSNHCLHHLLPNERDTGHDLRHRGHCYQLGCYI